jgi:outer membrane protein assembly factor BamB
MSKTRVLVGIILLLLNAAQASNWPRWGGPTGNGHVPEGGPVPEGLPTEPDVIWLVKVGQGLGSPVVADGRVYYLDNQLGKETMQAVDAATGKALWSAALDTAFQDTQSTVGPRGTPVADGALIYAQSCQGELQCLDSSSGKVVWHVNFVKDFNAYFLGEKGSAPGAARHGYTGSPWIDGERLFVGAGGTNGASLVCFEKRTGKVIWKSQNDIPGHAGPVLVKIADRKQVVSFTADGALAVAAEDGVFLWRAPIQTRLGRHAMTPIIVDDMVVVSSYLAGLIGIRVSRENETFKVERAWVEKPLAINFASPVAIGQYLYGLGTGRKLNCVDIRTGQRAWSPADLFSGDLEKEHVGMVAFKDRLLILGYNGRLILVAADPAEFRLLGSAQVCGANWCNPAYVDGKLFLRDEHELKCLRIIP